MRPTKAEQSITSAAYLLFYKRRSESPLGGNTSKLISEFLAKQQSEESDSTTPSPKSDLDRSDTSSPIPVVKPLSSSTSFMDPGRTIDTMYSLLRNTNASAWPGGYSNLAATAAANTGFSFGMAGMSGSTGGTTPAVESQNGGSTTQDDVDDAEIEVVGMDDVVENGADDEVQLIRIDHTDGEE